MTEPPLQLKFDGPVAQLRLMAPQTLNALSISMAEAMLEALYEVHRRPGIRTLVLSGEGRAFMAGGDLRYLALGDPGLAAARADTLIGCLHALIEAMVAFPIPIVAAVQGAVAGAGLSVMLASDFIVAAADTRFVFAYANLGTSPDGGLTWFLARSLGIRRAMHWAFLQKQLSAEEAEHYGLIQQVCEPESLVVEAIELAHKLASVSLHAFHRTKQLLRAASTSTLSEQLAAERQAFVSCAKTRDFAEGVTAFTEGRTPHFDLPHIEVHLAAPGTGSGV